MDLGHILTRVPSCKAKTTTKGTSSSATSGSTQRSLCTAWLLLSWNSGLPLLTFSVRTPDERRSMFVSSMHSLPCMNGSNSSCRRVICAVMYRVTPGAEDCSEAISLQNSDCGSSTKSLILSHCTHGLCTTSFTKSKCIFSAVVSSTTRTTANPSLWIRVNASSGSSAPIAPIERSLKNMSLTCSIVRVLRCSHSLGTCAKGGQGG